MSDAEQVVASMCEAYASAVNAGDSAAYEKLFTADAIRMPPGEEPEFGRDAIRRGEQASYDNYSLTVQSTPRHVLQISDEWIYAIADIEGHAVAHADGTKSTFRATKAWLLQRQPTGEWLLARHIWNLKPSQA